MASNRGVVSRPTVEAMLRFRALSAEQKLQWLEEMRAFLLKFQSPERRQIMQRFRRGDL